MPKQTSNITVVKTKRAVGVYLVLGIGIIVSVIAAIAYLFTGS